jgi:PPOX class probable F420-dependent enzyme
MTETTGLLDSVRGYLAQPRCAVLATIEQDGTPHQVVVHYLLEGHGLVINGRADRRWVSNLRRDARVSMVIYHVDQPLHWVGVKGKAALFREGPPAVEDAMRLAQRYGEDPGAYRDQQRVTFRVQPRRVYEYG